MTDEMLFYGGLVLAAAALCLLIGCSIYGHFKAKRLKKQLEDEYGPQIKK